MFEQGMKVAGWFVDQMEAHGWDIVGVFDDEAEEFERCGRADAFELLANLDECNMLFERGPYTVTVLMIPGNGEDVISDWSCAERHMEEINRIHNLALDCIEIFD
jgi:hypothetical protein